MGAAPVWRLHRLFDVSSRIVTPDAKKQIVSFILFFFSSITIMGSTVSCAIPQKKSRSNISQKVDILDDTEPKLYDDDYFPLSYCINNQENHSRNT